MRRPALGAMLLCVVWITWGCAKEWAPFTAPEGWQAESPGKPETTTTAWLFGSERVELSSYWVAPDVDGTGLLSGLNSGFYVAGAGVLPPGAGKKESLIQAMRKFAEELAGVAGSRVETVTSAELRAGVYELQAKWDSGSLLRIRAIRQPGNRMMYAATVNRRWSATSPSDGGRFLDSLQENRK